MSSIVYPNATHNRFSHSLGAMHIMEEVIDHLHRIGDIRKDDLDDVMKTGLAAALLHDIGHGPLSHSSEPILGFDHVDITAEIVSRPPISDILEKDGIKPERIVKIIRHTVSKRDVLVSQLVSSELDVDRLDYLMRDSYFTGAGFGNIDLERIITMLRVFDSNGPLKGHAISLYKGRFSIESYILGRHLMYLALYFHRATRGAEKLLANTFRRAAYLKTPGLIPSDLQFIEMEARPSADKVLALDDHNIFSALKVWEKNQDPVLSNLCKRILHRDLLKAIELTPDRATAYMTGVQEKFTRLARKHGIDPDYFCPIDGASETPYTVYRIKPRDDRTTVITNIFVYDEDDEPTEISVPSDVVRELAKKNYVDRLYMPAEIKEEARRLFKK
jgi:HD superfamily phosphohydrolase